MVQALKSTLHEHVQRISSDPTDAIYVDVSQGG